MKLIIVDTYPDNGKKRFEIDSIYMDRLIEILEDCIELPDRAAELLRAPAQNGVWICPECKAHNRDTISNCGFCDRPRFGG